MSDILMLVGIAMIVIVARKQERREKRIFMENWRKCRNRALRLRITTRDSARSGKSAETKEQAIETWNRRVGK